MSKQSYSLADFLLSEMKRRELGVREFARLIGVDHSTISKHLSAKPPTPTSDFLVKLSDATSISIEAMFALAFPDVAARTKLSARATILAQRLERQPEAVQDYIISKILGE